MRNALLRYRIIAYTVGVGLILLVFVAMPLKYFADSPTMVAIVGTAHGFLYMLYVVHVLELAFRCRWSLVRSLVIAAAGTIPFLSFVAERNVARDVGSRLETVGEPVAQRA